MQKLYANIFHIRDDASITVRDLKRIFLWLEHHTCYDNSGKEYIDASCLDYLSYAHGPNEDTATVIIGK